VESSLQISPHVIGADDAPFPRSPLSSFTDMALMHGHGYGHGLHDTVSLSVLYITAGVSKESLLWQNDCMRNLITVTYASGRSKS
jgi:hypothetical protein